MTVDDSFKKPGAVPFKWEVRPGVPKVQHQPPPPQHKQRPKQPPPPLSAPSSPFISQQRSLLSPTQQRLKPPPAGSYLPSPLEPRIRSFRSDPRTRSERLRFGQPARIQPDIVSTGCFPSPFLRRKDSKRKVQVAPPLDYGSDLETPSRRSFSSRKSYFSPSPLYGSPTSSFSSFRSSPRPVRDSQWAGFGLF